ncbi:MAG: ribonuclease E activity regulator RraA [Pseudomonadales bacterium]
MSLSTPDLCDTNEGDVACAEINFFGYGQKAAFRGQIVTIKAFEDNSLVREAVAEPGAGKVLVVDGGGSRRRAMLGDLLAEKAANNHWEGIIINGVIRDVDEIDALNIGVRALGSHPMKTDKRGEGRRNIPVQFANITFTPGHFVYADNNGIVVSGHNLD